MCTDVNNITRLKTISQKYSLYLRNKKPKFQKFGTQGRHLSISKQSSIGGRTNLIVITCTAAGVQPLFTVLFLIVKKKQDQRISIHSKEV